MGRHVFLSVLGFSALALIIGTLLSLPFGNDSNLGYPWQLEVMPDGSTRIFQVHLGQTTLAEAERLFQESAEITLFVPRGEKPVIEAYFDTLFIGGLKAKMVVSFELTDDDIEAMYKRGVRISTLGSGTRKVSLHGDDIARIKNEKIVGLTYLPSINLEAGLIEKRFGPADHKIDDSVSDGVHWLYADKGVDVVLSDDHKEVIQYVMPVNFDKLVAPLKNPQAE